MTNYIVSGLERSGTSLMMQILEKGGFPLLYDDSRRPDEDNPKGYYELNTGKIISRLIERNIDMSLYDDICIKITAYGLSFLPIGNYKIIYMERDIEEILASQTSMFERKGFKLACYDEKLLLKKMNTESKRVLENRSDMNFILVKHRDIFDNTDYVIKRISEFCERI